MTALKDVKVISPKKGCKHKNVIRTKEGDCINRLECVDCGYTFFMDQALFQRLRKVLEIEDQLAS